MQKLLKVIVPKSGSTWNKSRVENVVWEEYIFLSNKNTHMRAVFVMGVIFCPGVFVFKKKNLLQSRSGQRLS